MSGARMSGARMRLSLIVAMARNRVIGLDGGLPWRLSADLRRFKSLTMGHHLIMGRKTYDSLGRPLPGRTSIVLTRQANFVAADGVLLARDLDQAIALASAGGDDEAFVIGGAEIYRLALPRCDRLHVTRVAADVAGDTWFADWDESQWRLEASEPHFADEKNQYDFTFETYSRVRVVA